MKRFLCLPLLLFLCGCTYSDPVIEALPPCEEKVIYTEGEFQDYTDFAIYTFSLPTAAALERSELFAPVEGRTEDILSYIENFEGWVEEYKENDTESALAENYAFDKAIIDEHDYFYVKTKEGEPFGSRVYGKFDNYSLCFFDVDTNTLYYFHSNM